MASPRYVTDELEKEFWGYRSSSGVLVGLLQDEEKNVPFFGNMPDTIAIDANKRLATAAVAQKATPVTLWTVRSEGDKYHGAMDGFQKPLGLQYGDVHAELPEDLRSLLHPNDLRVEIVLKPEVYVTEETYTTTKDSEGFTRSQRQTGTQWLLAESVRSFYISHDHAAMIDALERRLVAQPKPQAKPEPPRRPWLKALLR